MHDYKVDTTGLGETIIHSLRDDDETYVRTPNESSYEEPQREKEKENESEEPNREPQEIEYKDYVGPRESISGDQYEYQSTLWFNTRSMLGSYEAYTELGFNVLPIKERDKKPNTGWKNDIQFDPEFHWIDGNDNIGMRVDDHWVLDLDAKDNANGIVNLDRALGAGTVDKLKEEAVYQRTGGGGLQFFFTLNKASDIYDWLNNSSNILGDKYPGIDVRFDRKGVVVLPPSIHPSGNVYEWGSSPALIEEAPDWFLDELHKLRQNKEKSGESVRPPQEASSWREDSKLLFDVESFEEVKTRVYQHVMDESDSRAGKDYANARVDSYDGEERLAVYANQRGVVGDWKGSPKSSVLLALGIDPRVWLLQYDANDGEFAKAFYYLYGNRIVWIPETKEWGKLQSDNTWAFFNNDSAIYDEYMKLVDDWIYAWKKAEYIRKQRVSTLEPNYAATTEAKKAKSRGMFMLSWLKTLKNFLGMNNRIGQIRRYSRRVRYAADWTVESFVRSRGNFDQVEDHEFPAANGVVNLKTGDMRDFAPIDYVTGVSAAKYDSKLSTLDFEREIAWWFGGNLDLLSYVQKVAGYAITGDITLAKLFLLHGEDGRNGKSTFLSLMNAVLGDDFFKDTMLNTLSNERESQYRLAQISSARLLAVREADVRGLNSMIVKLITGDETVSARPIYGKPFSYKRKFKTWVATNNLPSISHLDGGLQRRILVIPFAQIPEEIVNEGFIRRWTDRKDVVLKWLIDGAIKFYAEGLPTPDAVNEATEEGLREMNTSLGFIRRRIVFTSADQDRASRPELYQQYTAWCRELGYIPDTNRALYSALRTAYPKDIRSRAEVKDTNDERIFRYLKII